MGIFDFLGDLFDQLTDSVFDPQGEPNRTPSGPAGNSSAAAGAQAGNKFDWNQFQHVCTPEWLESVRAETGRSTLSFHFHLSGAMQKTVQEWQASGRGIDGKMEKEAFRQALRRHLLAAK